MNQPNINEITSLNFANLDVEELERRLELAATTPQPLAWCDCDGFTCTCDGTYCTSYCSDCATYCSDCADYCSGYCETDCIGYIEIP